MRYFLGMETKGGLLKVKDDIGSVLVTTLQDPPPLKVCEILIHREYFEGVRINGLGLTIPLVRPKTLGPCGPLVPKAKLGHSDHMCHRSQRQS